MERSQVKSNDVQLGKGKERMGISGMGKALREHVLTLVESVGLSMAERLGTRVEPGYSMPKTILKHW